MHQGSPCFSYLLLIDAQPPPLSRCCLRPLSHHPSNLTLVYPYPSSTYFGHRHLYSHTVLIRPLHVSQTISILPVWSTLLSNSLAIPASLRTTSFLNLSIRDTKNQTFHTLHLTNIHFPSLSTSHTPCLCSVQRWWYINSFVQKLLCIYPQSSIAQHTFQHSPVLIPLLIECTTSFSHSPSTTI